VFAGSTTDAGGDGGYVWALNASTGALLHNSAPILTTSGNLRMPATIDGKWVFVIDNNGNLYGMTIDPSYPAIQAARRAPSSLQRVRYAGRHR
jgi:outer membrane protein assembly factor BamB